MWHKGSRVQFSSITQQRGVVQFGRTLALGARGRWFKSSHLDNRRYMAKVINIHTGKESVVERVPMMECTICESKFDIEGEGGTTGYFGILMVAFCPFCLSSILDMGRQMLDIKDDE